MVANLGRGPDGRWSTLDGRRIYSQARTASFVYQAVLRSELSRELGVQWTPVRRGIAEIAGVPRPVLRAFSRRRAEIEAELERHGTSGPAASEAAALATRGRKDRSIGPEQLQAGDRAQELGFGLEQLETVLGRRRELERPVDWERVFDTLASPVGLTRAQSTFDRRDVIQALCERLPAGTVTDARLLEAAADRFLASDRTVALLPDGETRALLAREQLRYSTPRVARPGAAAHRPRHHPANLADAVRRRGGRLSGHQPTADPFRRAAADGRARLQISRASRRRGRQSRDGKTFALAAAREAWQQAGHPVLGVAVARRAARELTAGAGIEATSTAALVHDVHNGRPLPKGACSSSTRPAWSRPGSWPSCSSTSNARTASWCCRRSPPAARDRGRRAFRLASAAGSRSSWFTTSARRKRGTRALDHVADGRAAEAVAAYQQHGHPHRPHRRPDPNPARRRLVERARPVKTRMSLLTAEPTSPTSTNSPETRRRRRAPSRPATRVPWRPSPPATSSSSSATTTSTASPTATAATSLTSTPSTSG